MYLMDTIPHYDNKSQLYTGTQKELYNFKCYIMKRE